MVVSPPQGLALAYEALQQPGAVGVERLDLVHVDRRIAVAQIGGDVVDQRLELARVRGRPRAGGGQRKLRRPGGGIECGLGAQGDLRLE